MVKRKSEEQNVISASQHISESTNAMEHADTPARRYADTTDLDMLWKNIIGLIESNPTKTLLMQSESYLISLSEDVVEIGVSKDMFLPRLEHDTKKKEMILNSAKQASGKEPKIIKYRFLPRKLEQNSFESTPAVKTNDSEDGNFSSEAKISYKSKIEESSFQSDDLTGAIKNLLGAKEID